MDFKTPEERQKFKEITGRSVEEFFEEIKQDPHTYICAWTTHYGIRLFFFVWNEYIGDIPDVTTPEGLEKLKQVHNQNCMSVFEYLGLGYGFDDTMISKGGIVDESPLTNLTLPTFPCRKEGAHVNIHCTMFYKDDYVFEKPILKTHKNTLTGGTYQVSNLGYNPSEINDKYLKYYLMNSGNTQLDIFLSSKDYGYGNGEYGFICNNIKGTENKKLFFEILSKYYFKVRGNQGTWSSILNNGYEYFIKHCENNFRNKGDRQITLSSFFRGGLS